MNPGSAGNACGCCGGCSNAARPKKKSERAHQQFLDDRAGRERDGEPHAGGDVGGLHHLRARLGRRRDGAFVEDVGVDIAGEDRARAQAVGALLGVERLGEAGETEFRGDVGDAGLGAGLEPGLGVDEDESAGAARAHRGEQRLHAVKWAVEIRGHEFVVGGDGQFGPTPARGVGAGGVDERIDLVETREHGGDEGVHGRLIADIAGEGAEAFAGEGGDESEGRSEGIGSTPDQGNTPTFGGELEDDGAADAAAGTGDDSDGRKRGGFFWHEGERMTRMGVGLVASRIQRRVCAAGEKQGAELGRFFTFGMTNLNSPKTKFSASRTQSGRAAWAPDLWGRSQCGRRILSRIV